MEAHGDKLELRCVRDVVSRDVGRSWELHLTHWSEAAAAGLLIFLQKWLRNRYFFNSTVTHVQSAVALWVSATAQVSEAVDIKASTAVKRPVSLIRIFLLFSWGLCFFVVVLRIKLSFLRLGSSSAAVLH